MSLERLLPSCTTDDRQQIAKLYGARSESPWFFSEDGLAFLSWCDSESFSSADDQLVIPGLAAETVYTCAVAFTREEFLVDLHGQLSPVFAHPLGIHKTTSYGSGTRARASASARTFATRHCLPKGAGG